MEVEWAGRIGMKTVISVASLLACALSLAAQITTTLNRLPDGSDEVRIRNDSAVSLVASVIAGKRALPRDADGTTEAATRIEPFVVYSDPLIEPATKSLLAGEERVLMRN